MGLGGKRELLARALRWSGASFLLSHAPPKDMLLVLNYHRIGQRESDLFDPGVFSATGEQFDRQLAYLKRRVELVSLEEALLYVEGKSGGGRHCRALITFDDGYLDNYLTAYPILRSHNVQGVFFLVSTMVGSAAIPWWDHIAYLVKTAKNRRFSLQYPAELDVHLERDGLDVSLRSILRLYKRAENTDSTRFIHELAEASRGEDLPPAERRFLNWDEARAMQQGGMAFGSHTYSHPVLSQLSPGEQLNELQKSRSIMSDELARPIDVLAYPVGATTSFTTETQQAARDAGYRAAFSFYGGTNYKGSTSPYDVKRIAIDDSSSTRFQVQTSIARISGRYWP